MLSITPISAACNYQCKRNKPKGTCPRKKRPKGRNVINIRRLSKRESILQDLKEQLIIIIDDWDVTD